MLLPQKVHLSFLHSIADNSRGTEWDYPARQKKKVWYGGLAEATARKSREGGTVIGSQSPLCSFAGSPQIRQRLPRREHRRFGQNQDFVGASPFNCAASSYDGWVGTRCHGLSLSENPTQWSYFLHTFWPANLVLPENFNNTKNLLLVYSLDS